MNHLFVWIDHDGAFDAHLAAVGPRVARHPLAFALGTLVLAETPLSALIRRQACNNRVKRNY